MKITVDREAVSPLIGCSPFSRAGGYLLGGGRSSCFHHPHDFPAMYSLSDHYGRALPLRYCCTQASSAMQMFYRSKLQDDSLSWLGSSFCFTYDAHVKDCLGCAVKRGSRTTREAPKLAIHRRVPLQFQPALASSLRVRNAVFVLVFSYTS